MRPGQQTQGRDKATRAKQFTFGRALAVASFLLGAVAVARALLAVVAVMALGSGCWCFVRRGGAGFPAPPNSVEGVVVAVESAVTWLADQGEFVDVGFASGG